MMEEQPPSTWSWMQPAVAAVVLVLLYLLTGSVGAFAPPWMPTAAPMGGLWPPLVAALSTLLLLVFGRTVCANLWHRLAGRLHPQLKSTLGPGSVEREARLGFDRTDVILAAALAIGQFILVELYRQFYNPENQCIGHDNYAFLSTAVAHASGRWDLYMVDKRPLYGALTALLSHTAFSGDTIRAAVAMNMGAVSLLPVPTYLLGRFWGGRTAGLGAGLMLLGMSLMYPYAHETASYPLYNLFTAFTILLVSVALRTPSRRTFLFAGLGMALVTLTQVKNFTFNLPLLGLLVLAVLFDGQGDAKRRLLAIFGPVIAAVALLTAHPVEFTPLNVLIMHHREEVNYEIPYTWDQTEMPDPAFPSPISKYLPDALRWGEFEGIASTMLTAPNSDVFASFPGDGPNRRWQHCPNTSIPPVPVRLAHNLKQADTLAPGVGGLLFPLAGLGWLSVLLGGRGARNRLKLPVNWWHGAVLIVPLLSCFGSLSLKFNFRYVFHSVPATLVLFALAAVAMGRIALPNAGGVWRLGARLTGLFLCASMALALFIRAPLMSGELDLTAMKRAFFRLPPDARQLMGKGMMLSSAYLESHVAEDVMIYDCTPIAMSLYRPSDSRLIRPRNGSERDKLCRQQMDAPAGDTPRFLVVTSIPEFFGPLVLTPREVAKNPNWTLLYGYDMHGPRELGDPSDTQQIGAGWIAIFGDTPGAAPAGLSMLDGSAPGISSLEEGAPMIPTEAPGAPEAGNP